MIMYLDMYNTISCCGKYQNSGHRCVSFNKKTRLKDLSIVHDRSSIMIWKGHSKITGKGTWGCKALENGFKLWCKRRPVNEARQRMTKEVLENALIDKENIRLLEQEEEMRLEEEAQTERNRLQDAITSELKNVVLLKDLVDKFCKDFTKIAV